MTRVLIHIVGKWKMHWFTSQIPSCSMNAPWAEGLYIPTEKTQVGFVMKLFLCLAIDFKGIVVPRPRCISQCDILTLWWQATAVGAKGLSGHRMISVSASFEGIHSHAHLPHGENVMASRPKYRA